MCFGRLILRCLMSAGCYSNVFLELERGRRNAFFGPKKRMSDELLERSSRLRGPFYICRNEFWAKFEFCVKVMGLEHENERA